MAANFRASTITCTATPAALLAESGVLLVTVHADPDNTNPVVVTFPNGDTGLLYRGAGLQLEECDPSLITVSDPAVSGARVSVFAQSTRR